MSILSEQEMNHILCESEGFTFDNFKYEEALCKAQDEQSKKAFIEWIDSLDYGWGCIIIDSLVWKNKKKQLLKESKESGGD